jgi:hypothetical protein
MEAFVVPTTTNPGSVVVTPTPIQIGMTGSCERFQFIKGGDNYASIAKEAGISLADFYCWNTGLD